MTRHELKDDKWYLIKYLNDEYELVVYREFNNSFQYETHEYDKNGFIELNLLLNDQDIEWVEVNPRLWFELLSKESMFIQCSDGEIEEAKKW